MATSKNALASQPANSLAYGPRNLMGTQMLQRPNEAYLRQQFPGLYGALGGLLATAPDVMEGSVLDPNTAAMRQGAEYTFPIGTALGMLPGIGPGQKVAMTVGRVGERLAERAVPQIMQRGGLGADLLQGLANRTISPLDVYHGTPHTLPPTPRNLLGEFDASKIGTGEGAQAYGHGLYFAEARPVAEEYAKNLANADRFNQGRLTAHANAQRLAKLTGDPKYAADDIRFVLESNPDHDQKKLLTETLNFLESGNYKKPLENKGNLYKVDLPDEKINKMLDYDKHLSEQSKEVQNILLPYQKEIGSSFGTGEQTLKAIAFERRMKGLDDSPAAVAQQLKEMGIPGVKYLDAGSKQPGVTAMTQAQLDTRINILKKDIDSGLGNQDRMKQILSALQAERASHSNLTRNFVVFPGEEKAMTILERNSKTR